MLQINSGAGGTESQDWAEMLARMYRMYGEKQGWSVTEMDWQWGDGAGIKTCTYKFEGPFAYGFKEVKAVCTGWCVFPHLTVMREAYIICFCKCIPVGR